MSDNMLYVLQSIKFQRIVQRRRYDVTSGITFLPHISRMRKVTAWQ